MATLAFQLTISGQTQTASAAPTDARALEFIDDLRNVHYPQVDDGAGGTRVMTRQEAGQKYLDDLRAGQIAFARGLKQRRLDAEVAAADDLLGA